MKKVLSDRYFLGRKCIFCDNNQLYRLRDNRIKCKQCNNYYSIQKLRTDMMVLYYFYLEISARKAANELELNYKTIQDRFMRFRKKIAVYCNQEARKLNGELEIDESSSEDDARDFDEERSFIEEVRGVSDSGDREQEEY